MSAPVQILVSELQCRILVEVYLAHGPVDIFRLWSEMFERQKSISSGMLLFTRAIVQLEDEGYLQKVAEMNSTLAPKGEMYLIGAVLSGELAEGCWEKLSSTQNILDVARDNPKKTQAAVPETVAEKSCGTILDVAGQASGNAPLTDGFQVGSKRVSGTVEGHGLAAEVGSLTERGRYSDFRESGKAAKYQASPADSQFQGTTIESLVDAVFRAEEHAEQARLEEIEAEREGVDTAASGYPEPMYERNGR